MVDKELLTTKTEQTILKINEEIKQLNYTNYISDGCHTFGELYNHRITLYMALCSILSNNSNEVWMSKLHSDWTSFDWWFILWYWYEEWSQITYHIPIENRDKCLKFANELLMAPTFDWHTSDDVIERLEKLLYHY